MFDPVQQEQPQEQTDGALIAEMEDYFTRSKQMKQMLASEVMLNIAYFANDHDVIWNPSTQRLQRLRAGYRSSYFTNYVQQTLMQFVSKMTKRRPAWNCVPGTSDVKDVVAAQGGQKLLDAYYQKCGMRGIVEDSIEEAALAGICWLKVWWDPIAGDDVPDEAELFGAEMEGFLGGGEGPVEPAVSKLPAKTGDVRYKIVDFFQGFPDPQLTKLELDPFRFGEAHYMYRSEIEQTWPDFDAEGLSEDQAEEDQYGTIFGQISSMSDARRDKDAATPHVKRYLVKEYREMPTTKYPKGRLIQFCSKKIIARGDLIRGGEDTPARIGIRPMFLIRHPRRSMPIPLMTPIRVANAEYNSIRRHEGEYRRLMLRGVWLNPRGSGVPKSMFVGEDGSVIDYRPMGFAKPERLDVKQMPQMQDQLERLVGEMQGQLNIREITKGYAPEGVGAASALAILQEQDEASDAVIRRRIEDVVAWAGQETLYLLYENLEFERKIEIAGDAGEFEVLMFDKSKLKPWNVYVEQDSMMPKSKYAQSQFAKELFQLGGIVDEKGQPSAKKLGKILGNPFSTPDIYRSDKIDEQNALRENEAIRNGQAVTVMPEENDETHIPIHNAEIMTLKFATDPVDVLAREQLRAHVKAHLMQLMVKNGVGPGAQGPEMQGAPGEGPPKDPNPAQNGPNAGNQPAMGGLQQDQERKTQNPAEPERKGTSLHDQSGGLG